jgi:hypothetical protein
MGGSPDIMALIAQAVADRLSVGHAAAAEGHGTPIPIAAQQWLRALESSHDPTTRRQYRMYALTHWTPRFRIVEAITSATAEEYWRARELVVINRTVRKELSGLRCFTAWAAGSGIIPTAPTISGPPRLALGTPDASRPHKLHAVELEPDEVEELLEALPEWSSGGGSNNGLQRFRVRDAMIVSYETAWRPETLAQLRAPDDYRRGAATAIIRPEADKARWA